MKKTLFLVAGLLFAAGAAAWWSWPFGNNHALKLTGVVEIQEVRLASKSGGRVSEILVKEGEIVSPGRPLVTLDIPEWIAQKQQWEARVKAAEAEAERSGSYRPEEREAARAAAQAAEARYHRIRAARPLEILQAESEWKAACAESTQAAEDYARTSVLYFNSKSVQKADYDAALAARDRARARADAARIKRDLLDKTHHSDVAEAKAEWDQAEAKRVEMEKGPRQEDRDLAYARLAEARAKLAEVEVFVNEGAIRAPEKLGRARVELIAVRPGDILTPNAPAIRVLRTDDWWVKVFVPETKIGHLKEGQTAEVYLDTFPGKAFRGVVTEIANIAEFTPRNVQSVDERRHQVFAVKIRIDDPGSGAFHAGMAAEVVIPLK